jgi:CheY-like chemotaxis protein
VGGVEGAGADFWFEAAFAPAGEGAPAPSLEGRVVAIVSPSAIVREAAARQIEASGGRAVRAQTIEAAAPLTDVGDVVLVDHLLAPEGELIVPPPERTAIVLLRPEERERIAPYRKAGFAGYLIKPLRRASLVERVLLAGKAAAHDDDRVAPRPPRETMTAGGVKVLMAEDNPINAMLARTLLRREGAEIHHVEGGEAALEALIGATYDLILMDVRMPGLGGLEATRALRARGVDTPVVALTANAFEDDRRACMDAGMDDFLVKPLSPEALRVALARWTGPGWTRRPRRAKVVA